MLSTLVPQIAVAGSIVAAAIALTREIRKMSGNGALAALQKSVEAHTKALQDLRKAVEKRMPPPSRD